MDEKQMTEEQKRELSNAISKLSEEDQLQIAGGVISDEQCKKLQQWGPGLVAYGGPCPPYVPPYVPPLTPEKLKEIVQKKAKPVKEPTQPIPEPETGDQK